MATVQHRWPFDGHLRDTIGSADASFLGTALFDKDPDCVAGGVHANVNAADSGVSISSITLNDEFSISIWVKRTSWSSSYFLIGNSSDGDDGWCIYVIDDGATDYIQFATSNGTSYAFATSNNVTLSTSAMNHIVVTCDRSTGDNVKIYINGVDETDTGDDDCRTDFALTGGLRLGVSFSDADELYGDVDDISIWDDVLSSADVNRMWLDGGYIIDDPNNDTKELAHRWRFDSLPNPPVTNTYCSDDVGSADGWFVGSAATTTSYENEGIRAMDNNIASNSGMLTTRFSLQSEKFSFGIYLKKWGGTGLQAIGGNLDSAGNNDGIYVYWDYTNTRIEVRTGNGTSTAYAYSDAPSYVTGTTYHIAISVDRNAGTCQIFQDGVDITSSDNDVLTDFKLYGQWQFGLDFDNLNDFWVFFDDIQIYKGYLTEDDWAQVGVDHMPSQVYLKPEFEKLIARYKFEVLGPLEDSVNNFDLWDHNNDGSGWGIDTDSGDYVEGSGALECDGANFALSTPKIPLNPTNHAFVFWLKPGDMSSSTAYQYLFGTFGWEDDKTDGGGADQGGIRHYIRESQDSIYTRGYYDNTNYYYTRSNDNCLTVDTWHHVVITYDLSAGKYDIYVDGVDETLFENYPTSGYTIKVNSRIQIGSRYNPIDGRLEGWMDDLQIYNKTITLAEAKFLTANIGATIYDWKGTINTGSIVTGQLTDGTPPTSPITGTINTASTVTADLVGRIRGTVTVSTASLVSADITGRGVVTGTITTASAVSADITGKGVLSGTVTTASVVTGQIRNGAEIHGQIDTSSTVTGVMVGRTELSGTIGTASVVTGKLIATVPITGTINTGSTVSGNLLGKSELSGAIDTATTVTGNLLGFVRGTGTINTSSTVTADLTSRTSIEGTINTGSTVTGHLSGKAPLLSGTINTATTVTGDCRNQAHTSPISGSISTGSAVSGAMVRRRRGSGTIETSSAVSGIIQGRGMLSGTINTGSTVEGDLDPTRGTISTVTTVTGQLSGKQHLFAGVISTVTTVSGAIERGANIKPISGVINTFSTVDAHLIGRIRISGSVSTSSEVTGHLTATVPISGTINTASVVSGDVRSKPHTHPVSGTISTGSIVTGAITYKLNVKHISGTINTGSVVSGYGHRYIMASGTINTGSTVTGTIKRNLPISGTINTGSIVTGDLTKKSHEQLSGSIATATTVTGKLIGHTHLSGSVNTRSIVTGDINAEAIFGGTINTGSVVLGHLSGKQHLFAGTITTGSVVSAFHTSIARFSGTIVTGSVVTGDLQARTDIRGQINTGSTVSGKIVGRFRLSGSFHTSTGTSGKLIGHTYSTGGIFTESVVSGQLISKPHTKQISGSVSCSSSVTGQLTHSVKISGTINTRSIVTGKLQAKVPISATITSQTSVSGVLKGKATMTATVNGASIVGADLKGIGLMGGSTVSRSMVLGILRTKGIEYLWIDGMILEDVIKASIFEEDFEGKVLAESIRCSVMEENLKVVIDEPDLKFSVMEDTLEGIMEDEETLTFIE